MGHLKNLNQTDAFFFFYSSQAFIKFSIFLPLFVSKPHLRHSNPIQNKTCCLHTDLSISLKPSGLQEYEHPTLFPCSLCFLWIVSMTGIRSSSTPYKCESKLGCTVLYTLGTGSMHIYQGIDPFFFPDPFLEFVFLWLDHRGLNAHSLESSADLLLSRASVEIHLFQPKYLKPAQRARTLHHESWVW